MNKLKFAFTLFLVLGLGAAPLSAAMAQAQDPQNQSVSSALMRGYRTGYSDGFQAGVNDVGSGATQDFRNKAEAAVERIIEARPDVYNHNLETVPRLYPTIRPGARYYASLRLLESVKREARTGILRLTNSGAEARVVLRCRTRGRARSPWIVRSRAAVVPCCGCSRVVRSTTR